MSRVFVFAGTRPEAVKMAPVVQALRGRPGVDCRLCVTGQHRELLDPVLEVFDLAPDIRFDPLPDDTPPATVLATVTERAAALLRDERPDWALAQGDTSTVAAVSLAAFLERVPLGHVEAGLRTYDRERPFPEEVFRRVADLVADAYFAPTEGARANLLREGAPEAAIHVTGNTVVDALYRIRDWLDAHPDREMPLPPQARDKRLVLVTVHRRENIGPPLERICDALLAIADGSGEGTHLVCTVHPNPAVAGTLRGRLSGHPRLTLIEPAGYLDFVALMRAAHLILTDSGGVQEEAPAFGKPVLVLREVTERPEVVEAGVARLVGSDTDAIVREAEALLNDDAAYRRMAQVVNPFGDGRAAERIADVITSGEGRKQG